MQRVWCMRAVEWSLASLPRTIAFGTGARGSATGAGAPQPSSVAAKATPSQMHGKQRMIHLLLATVATATALEVLHGFQCPIEACDRTRFDGKPASLGPAIGIHRNPQDLPLLA